MLKPHGGYLENFQELNKSMSNDRIHHCYSPSKLQSLEACPKYASSFSTSEAAAMGTKQHEVAESGIDNPDIPDEKAAGVAASLQFLDERRALHLGHTLLKECYLPIDEETIVAPDGGTFTGTTAGYIDAAIISADVKSAELIDFKFGKNAPESAENNLQGAAYALGLLHRFPTLQKIMVWFVMPHLDQVSGTEFSLDDLARFHLRIKVVVNRAIEANFHKFSYIMATPNQSACLFCANLGVCPKVAEIALKVGKKYAPLDIPDSISTVVFEDQAQVATGLKLAAVIKTWAEAYRTQATAKSIESDFIPDGYKLVSTTKRKVVNAHKFGDVAKSMLPATDHGKVDALFDIPIGGVEKLIENSAPRGMKAKKSEELGELALAAGALELGKPYAFLRQNNAKE